MQAAGDVAAVVPIKTELEQPQRKLTDVTKVAELPPSQVTLLTQESHLTKPKVCANMGPRLNSLGPIFLL